MTFHEGSHITKDGWILVFMALTLMVSASGIGAQFWSFYSPISREAFTEYKDGAKLVEGAIDKRLDRIEGKVDEITDFLHTSRGLK